LFGYLEERLFAGRHAATRVRGSPIDDIHRVQTTKMRVRIALAGGLVLVAGAIGLTLTRAAPRLLGSDSVPVNTRLATTTASGASVCQSGETLPRGTTIIRLSVDSVVGPTLTVRAFAGRQLLARGWRAAGWAAGYVAVPVRPVAREHSGVRVCITVGRLRGEGVTVLGSDSPASVAATGGRFPLAGRMRIDYFGPGRRAWASRIATIVDRIGLGHVWGGAWNAILVLASLIAVSALASWWTLRALGGGPGAERTLRGIPLGAAVCALVALLSAAGWSILSPPFQLPDEPDHFAYTQQLAETARLPDNRLPSVYSPEERTILIDLHYLDVRREPNGTISSAAEQDQLDADLASGLSRRGSGYAGDATAEPPLYYALQTIPYRIATGASILARLQLMRLLSALMGAATALFAFLFVREALPREPWAWTVGGLGVALAPAFGSESGAVSPDALLFAVSAALFYCVARGFRRGLSGRLALAVGVLVAAGCLTKTSFFGLVPGALLALLVLGWRELRATGTPTAHGPLARGARGWRSARLVLVAVLLPAGLYALFGRHAAAVLSSSAGVSGDHGSIAGEISYIWQLYLPRLPGMSVDFPDLLSTRTIWIDSLIGLYGWVDTVFPGWVYDVALIPIAVVSALFARALLLDRRALRDRLPELLVYLVLGAGVLAIVGGASYIYFLQNFGAYQQIRYLFPLLAPLAVVLALAARGAGRRWGPAAGAAIVVLVLAHDIFSQLLVAGRYYG
jgi:Predicted membrane protein (DUF2142)